MIRREAEMRTLVREHLRGGEGTIENIMILEPEQMLGKCTLCAKFFFAPGTSIGEHAHVDDAEIYYVLEGELTVVEDGVEHILKPGDVAFTANGASHKVENRTTQQAVMLAVILP